jgi:hypothetical protein
MSASRKKCFFRPSVVFTFSNANPAGTVIGPFSLLAVKPMVKMGVQGGDRWQGLTNSKGPADFVRPDDDAILGSSDLGKGSETGWSSDPELRSWGKWGSSRRALCEKGKDVTMTRIKKVTKL